MFLKKLVKISNRRSVNCVKVCACWYCYRFALRGARICSRALLHDLLKFFCAVEAFELSDCLNSSLNVNLYSSLNINFVYVY